MIKGEVTTSIEKAAFLALYLFSGFLAVGLVLHLILWWGNISSLSLLVRFFPYSLILLPLFLVAGMVFHELLHALIISLAAPSGWQAVKFGFLNWMTPYCHCTEPISASAYRLVLLFPFILLGLLPWGWGLCSGIIELTIWGAIFISAAGGDLLIFFLIRDLSGRTLIQDHPRKVGVKIREERKRGRLL